MTTDMIVKELPRICTTPLAAPVVLLPTGEEMRRNQVITDLLKTRFFYIGQRVRPKNEEAFQKDGYARITGIADTYQKFKGTLTKDEWPKNDNPMIIAASFEKNGFNVNATVTYFRAV